MSLYTITNCLSIKKPKKNKKNSRKQQFFHGVIHIFLKGFIRVIIQYEKYGKFYPKKGIDAEKYQEMHKLKIRKYRSKNVHFEIAKIFFQQMGKIIDEKKKVCYNVIWTRAD